MRSGKCRMIFAIFYLCFLLKPVVDCKDSPLPVRSFLMPAIYWDARNPIFNCPSKGVNTILVRPLDYLTFVCPMAGRNFDWHQTKTYPSTYLYESLYLTENATAMEHCDATSAGTQFLRCDSPDGSTKSHTFRLRYNSMGGRFEVYKRNTSYHIFATSTGLQADIDQRVGGRCAGSKYPDDYGYTYKMQLKFRICPEEDVGTERCPVCTTAACYNKGCGQYDDWADPDPKRYYRDVTNLQKDGIASITKAAPVVEQENKCFNYKKRKCDDSMWGCVGPDVKETTSSCPSAMVEPSHTNCTTTGPQMYFTKEKKCVQLTYSTCTIGSLEKFRVTNFTETVVPCPAINFCEEWKNLTGIYNNGTTHCFRVQRRQCDYECRQNITETRVVDVSCPLLPSSTPRVVPRSSPSSIPTSVSALPCVTIVTRTASAATKPTAVPKCDSTATKTTDIHTGCKCNGRIADSKSANQSSSILSYLVPIAAALVGCLIGGTAVWLYKKPKHPELSVSYNGDSQCAFENTNFDGDTHQISGTGRNGNGHVTEVNGWKR